MVAHLLPTKTSLTMIESDPNLTSIFSSFLVIVNLLPQSSYSMFTKEKELFVVFSHARPDNTNTLTRCCAHLSRHLCVQFFLIPHKICASWSSK